MLVVLLSLEMPSSYKMSDAKLFGESEFGLVKIQKTITNEPMIATFWASKTCVTICISIFSCVGQRWTNIRYDKMFQGTIKWRWTLSQVANVNFLEWYLLVILFHIHGFTKSALPHFELLDKNIFLKIAQNIPLILYSDGETTFMSVVFCCVLF